MPTRRKAFIIDPFITELLDGWFHLCTLTQLNNFFSVLLSYRLQTCRKCLDF